MGSVLVAMITHCTHLRQQTPPLTAYRTNHHHIMASSSAYAMNASKRLLKEIKEYAKSPNPVLAALGPIDDDDLLHWSAVLLGSPGTIYEGCRWTIDIQIPEQYPHNPPLMVFKTPCCHPNVHPKVCKTFFSPFSPHSF